MVLDAVKKAKIKNKDGDIAENERADCLIGEAQPDEADNATKIPHAVCYPTPKDVNSEKKYGGIPSPRAWRGERVAGSALPRGG